jgi:hypothetical protein
LWSRPSSDRTTAHGSDGDLPPVFARAKIEKGLRIANPSKPKGEKAMAATITKADLQDVIDRATEVLDEAYTLGLPFVETPAERRNYERNVTIGEVMTNQLKLLGYRR